MKKLITILLCGILALSLGIPAFAAGSDDAFAKYDPEITVKTVLDIPADFLFAEGDSAENNIYTRAFKDELGINVEYEWITYTGGADDKKKLMIASNDLPDFMYVNRSMFEMLIKSGQIEDLTEAFETYATDNLKSYFVEGEPARTASTRDGNLYAIPNYNDYRETAKMIWIRSDWLENLNLAIPTTGEELLAAARAFTNDDPDGNGMDDTYGIAFPFANITNASDGLGSAYWNMFHSYPDIWIDDGNGGLAHGMFGTEAQLGGTRKGLETLQELYREGVLNKEFATMNWDQVAEACANGKFGIMFYDLWGSYWPLQGNVSAEEGADWIPIPIVSMDSEPAKVSGEAAQLHQFQVVRKGFEYPEAVVKLLNLFDKYNNDPETADLAKWNTDPLTNQFISNLCPVVMYDPLFNLRAVRRIVPAVKQEDPSLISRLDEVFYQQITDYLGGGDVNNWCVLRSYGPDGSLEVCDYYVQNEMNLTNNFTGVSTDLMVEKKSILDKMWLETCTLIIMGQDLSTFDSFVSEYMAAGGDETAAEVNDWYKNQ